MLYKKLDNLDTWDVLWLWDVPINFSILHWSIYIALQYVHIRFKAILLSRPASNKLKTCLNMKSNGSTEDWEDYRVSCINYLNIFAYFEVKALFRESATKSSLDLDYLQWQWLTSYKTRQIQHDFYKLNWSTQSKVVKQGLFTLMPDKINAHLTVHKFI